MITLAEIFPDGLPQAGAIPLRQWGPEARFRDLLDWPDVERILAESCFDGPGTVAIAAALGLAPSLSRVCVISQGKTIWRVPRQVDADLFAVRLAGATLRIEAVEEVHPPLAPLAEALQSQAPAAYFNLYAAWGHSPGLALHYDYTDILVLQLRGEKHWRIYRPTRPAIRGSESTAYKEALQQAERGEGGDPEELQRVQAGLFWEGVLTAGEALFVPPGWFHAVRPTGGPTLHLSCAFGAPAGPGGTSPRLALPQALRVPEEGA